MFLKILQLQEKQLVAKFFLCLVGWGRKISVKFFCSLFPKKKIENVIMTTNIKIVKSDVINESNHKTIVRVKLSKNNGNKKRFRYLT